MGFFTFGPDCCTISALSETPHELEHGIENLKWSSTRMITEARMGTLSLLSTFMRYSSPEFCLSRAC